MTNENTSNAPSASPEGQSAYHPPVIPPAPLQGASPDDGKRKSDEAKNEADELAREFRAAEKWVIGTNIVLAIVGIFALCIYYGQLRVMRGQLGEIVKQYPELQKSADAAVDSANAAKIAAQAAQKSIDVSIESDRPWVGPAGVEMAPKGDYELTVTPHIVNSGRSPALLFDAEWNYHLYVALPDNPEYRPRQGTHPLSSTYLLVPGRETKWEPQEVTLLKQDLEDLAAGKVGLYFFMRLKYKDLRTQEIHHTKLCWIFKNIHTTGVCNEYNNAD